MRFLCNNNELELHCQDALCFGRRMKLTITLKDERVYILFRVSREEREREKNVLICPYFMLSVLLYIFLGEVFHTATGGADMKYV